MIRMHCCTPFRPSPLTVTQAAPGVPVVYVALGTLAVLPHALIAALHDGMARNSRFRFLWVFPDTQAGLLPPESMALADSMAWKRALNSSSAESCPSLDSSDAPVLRPLGAGSILLSHWLPQVAVLSHVMVSAFLTHGGMNSIAEATFAHVPMLCMPFFSDQPDNCVHAEVGTHVVCNERYKGGTDVSIARLEAPLCSLMSLMQDLGYAVTLWRSSFRHSDISAALDRLLPPNVPLNTELPALESIHRAWLQNVAAGGIVRAVQVT